MSNAEKTLVTVATYNEMENLTLLVDEIFRYLPDADLLVIDDNSPDGTGAWCDKKGAEDPRVLCLHRSGKLGLGTAIIAGMKYGIEHGYRYVLNMDADFSHPPKCLPNLVAGMDPPGGPGADVMIGSRQIPGGGVEGWGWKRHLMSWGVNTYARLLLGLKATDCSGSFPLLSHFASGETRFRCRSQPRIFLPRGNPLASQTPGRTFRRNSLRLHRPHARPFENQFRRSHRRTNHNLQAGNAKPLRPMKKTPGTIASATSISAQPIP